MQCARRIASRAEHALPVSTMVLPEKREAPLQILEQPALLLLRQGNVRIHERKSSPRQLPKGSIGYYPAGADYDGCTWTAGNDSLYCVLDLPETICASLLDRQPTWLSEIRQPLRFLDPKLMWWIDEIEQHCVAGEPNGALYTEAVSLALLTYLDARLCQRGDAAPARHESLSQQSVRKMQDYIDAHISESLSIRELALVCGYSPTHFARIFKEGFGMPVHQFVMQRRIALARNMLHSDDASLAEVAVSCGFSSQAHFNVSFKRREGMTPGDFRAARLR
ncbi:helix-turn-helix domain-containing protein [Noviherbaspirillum galbum]|uniref:Helix-turn-helix transcriptional regulator n=1 Tax=Noviherbaspirillum galbum TaxID=2709383 RepID=A0A6B3SV24_9BURK|nr:AraC family transcriptional regulator [Noviherbaspirillum galbum]NEX62222.1 helix-turn-helix transcriptional regulator [Noviherbaspirillum galbum]